MRVELRFEKLVVLAIPLAIVIYCAWSLLGNVNVSQGRDTLNQALGGKTAVVKPQH